MAAIVFGLALLLCFALVGAGKHLQDFECPTFTGAAIGEIACFSPEVIQNMVPEGKEELAAYLVLHGVPGFESFLSEASTYYVPGDIQPVGKCPVDRDALARVLKKFSSRDDHSKEGHTSLSLGRKLRVIKSRNKERSQTRCFCIKPCEIFPLLNCDDDDKHCMCD